MSFMRRSFRKWFLKVNLIFLFPELSNQTLQKKTLVTSSTFLWMRSQGAAAVPREGKSNCFSSLHGEALKISKRAHTYPKDRIPVLLHLQDKCFVYWKIINKAEKVQKCSLKSDFQKALLEWLTRDVKGRSEHISGCCSNRIEFRKTRKHC